MSALSQLIKVNQSSLVRIARSAVACASRLGRDRRGNVLVVFAIALPLMIGGLGLGVEGANWYQTRRALQNAADEAVVAAATNNTSTYLNEAKAVSAQYGFTDGSNNVTVTASNAATCPPSIGGANCYSVTITKKVKLLLTPAIGFGGDSTIGSAAAQLISATAVASYQTSTHQYCILALASSAPTSSAIEFQTNGAPKANLNGCNVMSNASMDCNGHNLGATYGDAHGTSSGCGLYQDQNMPTVSDPYSSLALSIPDPGTKCSGGYPQEPTKKSGTPLPSSNLISGSHDYGSTTFCGDVQLTGNITLTGTDNVIVIRNGQLDTNGYSITTATGAAATVIFSGDNGSYNHTLTGGGTVDLAAPTSGTWSGMAIYTDPNLTTGVDMSAAGNSPSWNLSGVGYFPHSSVTFSGAVGKATTGYSCFILVVDNMTINGTGSILNQSQCPQAGVTMPEGVVPTRGRLVA